MADDIEQEPQEPVVRPMTDWDSLDLDDLDAVQAWVFKRRAYLDTVLAAGPLPRRGPSRPGAAAS